MKISLTLIAGLLAFTASAQQPFRLNDRGEVLDARFPAFVKQHQYQVVSGFDTVSKKPLLIYAIYVKNKKMGIMDNSGREITPAIYDKIDGMDKEITANMWGFPRRYIVQKNGKYGLIDNRGTELLAATYDNLFNGSGDSILMTYQGNRKVYLDLQGKPTNFPDPDAKPSQPYVPQYQQKLNADQSSWHLKNNYKKGEMDVPNLGIPSTVYNGQVIFMNKTTHRYGVYNTRLSKLVIPIEYERIEISPPGMFIVFKSQRYGVIDSLGQTRLPSDYEGITRFTGGALVYKNKKYAQYDSAFKPLSDFVYDGYNYLGNIICLKKDGKNGILDPKGKVIVPFKYDEMTIYKQSEIPVPMAVVSENGLKGAIDLRGKVLSAPRYEILIPECVISGSSNELYPEPLYSKNRPNRYFIYKKDGKYGLLDNNFAILLPNEYDKLLPSSSDGLVCINKGGKWGVMDSRTKKMILPIEFDWKPESAGLYFQVILNHKYGLYDNTGKEIIPANESLPVNFDNIYKGFLIVRDLRAQTISYADQYGHRVIIHGPTDAAHK